MTSGPPLTVDTALTKRSRASAVAHSGLKSNFSIPHSCLSTLQIEGFEIQFVLSSDAILDWDGTPGGFDPPYCDLEGAANLEEALRKIAKARATRSSAKEDTTMSFQFQGSSPRKFILAHVFIKSISTLLPSISSSIVRLHWQEIYLKLIQFIHAFSQNEKQDLSLTTSHYLPWLLSSTACLFNSGWSAIIAMFTSPREASNVAHVHRFADCNDLTPTEELCSSLDKAAMIKHPLSIMHVDFEGALENVSSMDPAEIMNSCLHTLSFLSDKQRLDFSCRLNASNRNQSEGHMRSLLLAVCMMMRFCGSSSCQKYDTFIKVPMTKIATLMGYSSDEDPDFILFLGSDALRIELKRAFELLDIKYSIVGNFRYIQDYKSVVSTLLFSADLPVGTSLDVLRKEHVDAEGMYIGPVGNDVSTVKCHNGVTHELHLCVGIVYDQACIPQFKAMVNDEVIADYFYHGEGFLRSEEVIFEGRPVSASVLLVDTTTDAANWGKSSQDQKPQYFTTISARIINFQRDCINCADGVILLGMHNCNDKNHNARNNILEIAHRNLRNVLGTVFAGASNTIFVLRAFTRGTTMFSVNDMMYYRGAGAPFLSGWNYPNHTSATTSDQWIAHVEGANKALISPAYMATLENAISNTEIEKGLLLLLGGDVEVYHQVIEQDNTLILVPRSDACSLAVLSHLPVQDIRIAKVQYDGETFLSKIFITEFMHMLAKVICHFFKRALGLAFVISGSSSSFIDTMKAHFKEECDGFTFNHCQSTGKISLTFDWGSKSSNVLDIALRLTNLFPRHVLNDTSQQRKLKCILTDSFKLLQEVVHMYHERDVKKQKHWTGYMVAMTNAFFHMMIVISGANAKTIVAYSNVFLNQMTYWANVAHEEGLSIERATSCRGNESQHHSIQRLMSGSKQSLSSTAPLKRIVASMTSLFDSQMVPHVYGAPLGLFSIRLKAAKIAKEKNELKMQAKPWYRDYCSKMSSITSMNNNKTLVANDHLLVNCHSSFLHLSDEQIAALRKIIENTPVVLNREEINRAWQTLTLERNSVNESRLEAGSTLMEERRPDVLHFREEAVHVADDDSDIDNEEDSEEMDTILMTELLRMNETTLASDEKLADHEGIRNLDAAPPAFSNFSFGGVSQQELIQNSVPSLCRFGFCYIKGEMILTVTYPNQWQEKAVIPFQYITKLHTCAINFIKVDTNNLKDYDLFSLRMEIASPMIKIERKIDNTGFKPLLHGSRFLFESTTTNLPSKCAAWAKEFRLVFKGTLKPHKTFVKDLAGGDPDRVRVSFVRDGKVTYEELCVAPDELRNWVVDFLASTSQEMLDPSNVIPLADNNEELNAFNNDSPALKTTNSVALFIEKMKMIPEIFLFSSKKAKQLLFFQICKVCLQRKYISEKGWALSENDCCHGSCMREVVQK